MLTDAEMQRLLDERKKFVESLPYVFVDDLPEEEAYLRALDLALPQLVEEVRRLRIGWVDSHAGTDFVRNATNANKMAYYERGSL